MKQNIKSLLTVLALLVFTTGYLYAQRTIKDSIRFNGQIDSTGNTGYYIRVGYSDHNWFTPAGFVNKIVKIDSLGKFEFCLPSEAIPYKINLGLKKRLNDVAKTSLLVWSGVYYAQKGDHIVIDISWGKEGKKHPKASFSGIGSDKYKLIENLDDQFYNYATEGLHSIKINNGLVKDSVELETKMEKLAVLLRQYTQEKHVLISNANVSETIKAIVGHEYAKYYSEWVFRAKLCYDANPSFHKQMANIYLRHAIEFDDKPDQLSILCPEHLDMISAKDAFEQMISNYSDKAEIVAVYNIAKQKYPENIRARLISNCFFSIYIMQRFAPHTSSTRDSLLQDAYHFIKDTTIKKSLDVLIVNLNKVGSGKPVYISKFIDRDGQQFDINSLKGKVVLIDLWFNGCTGCAQFHEAFETGAYQKFKDNKNFIVIALSMDATKERWVAGLKSHHYTSDSYINIWTGPLVTHHPFMKYYNITGAPFLMLIGADGNIIDKPDPGTSTVPKLIEEIKNALNNNKVN